MTRTASRATLDFVTRALYGVAALVGILGVVLALRTLVDLRSSNALEAESRVMEQQARKSNQPLPPAVDGTTRTPRGLEVLRTLQAAVTKGAAEHHCQLAEFKSATQTAPYTPRYKKNVPDEPWSQMDAHFTINGRLRDVMETLRCLNNVPIPIEIDGINIARERIDEDGSTKVSAQIDLRAIAQGTAS